MTVGGMGFIPERLLMMMMMINSHSLLLPPLWSFYLKEIWSFQYSYGFANGFGAISGLAFPFFSFQLLNFCECTEPSIGGGTGSGVIGKQPLFTQGVSVRVSGGWGTQPVSLLMPSEI